MADEDEEPVDDEVLADGDEPSDDPELEEMKRRVAEMEDEAAKLKAMQQELAGDSGSATGAAADKPNDEKSIHVSQVDYDATPEELQAHFASCGTINRVTILVDKFTGRSKGFAYIEFDEKDSVANAVLLDNSIFKGRQLKVTAKRVNIPGRGKGKGKGGRGRGRKGGYKGYRGGYGKGYKGYKPY